MKVACGPLRFSTLRKRFAAAKSGVFARHERVVRFLRAGGDVGIFVGSDKAQRGAHARELGAAGHCRCQGMNRVHAIIGSAVLQSVEGLAHVSRRRLQLGWACGFGKLAGRWRGLRTERHGHRRRRGRGHERRVATWLARVARVRRRIERRGPSSPRRDAIEQRCGDSSWRGGSGQCGGGGGRRRRGSRQCRVGHRPSQH